jgi:hypothetical protein
MKMLENADAMQSLIAYKFGHNTWYNIYDGGFILNALNEA